MRSNASIRRGDYLYLRWCGNVYKMGVFGDFANGNWKEVVRCKTKKNYVRIEHYEHHDADSCYTYRMFAIFLPEISRYLVFGDTWLTNKFAEKYITINTDIFKKL